MIIMIFEIMTSPFYFLLKRRNIYGYFFFSFFSSLWVKHISVTLIIIYYNNRSSVIRWKKKKCSSYVVISVRKNTIDENSFVCLIDKKNQFLAILRFHRFTCRIIVGILIFINTFLFQSLQRSILSYYRTMMKLTFLRVPYEYVHVLERPTVLDNYISLY